MEPWLRGALRRSSPGVKVIEAGPPRSGRRGRLPPNPHVWLDPLLACRLVTNILTALQALDPRTRSLCSQRLRLVARLEALHREIKHA